MLLLIIYYCYGLNVLPPNSYVETLPNVMPFGEGVFGGNKGLMRSREWGHHNGSSALALLVEEREVGACSISTVGGDGCLKARRGFSPELDCACTLIVDF